MAEPLNVQGTGARSVQKKLRLHPVTVDKVKHWAEREGVTESEYMALAVEEKLARAVGDFDVPNLAVQRLNQIVDELKAVATGQQSLIDVTTTGFESLLGMARGDSYLLDPESGELDIDDTAGEGVGL